MSFGNTLVTLREKEGISRKELAMKLEIPYTTLRNYETDQREPGHELLIKISNLFSVSVDFLLGLTNESALVKSYSLSTMEYSKIEKYRILDEHGKRIVDMVLDEEYDRTNDEEKVIQLPLESEPENVCSTLNVSELKASAGTGVFLSEETMRPVQVEFNRLTARADFAVPVDGDSMLPKFKDGDILLVHKQPAVNVGEIGIFIIDGKGFVKKQGPDRLISLNEDYEDIYPGENDYTKCCGKVIGILEPEWILE